MKIKDSSAILPDVYVTIPLKGEGEKIAVMPTLCGVDPLKWPTQICSVVQGKAEYVNRGKEIIKCPKYAHFTVTNVSETGQSQEKELDFKRVPHMLRCLLMRS